MAAPRQDPKYIAVLAVSCVAILWIGAALRPPGQPNEGSIPGISQDRSQLERIAQRRQLELGAQYYSYLASQAEATVVLLGKSGHTAVVWQPGQVLTSARRGPFPARDSTALGSREVALQTRLAGPHLPYVLLEAPPDAEAASRAPVRLYPRGSALMAVWRAPDGGLRYAPGTLFGVELRLCGDFELSEVQTNLHFHDLPRGAGIFALDGNLLAVAMECEGDLIGVDAADLASRISTELTLEQRLISRYGMRAAQADERELDILQRTRGVILREVWWGYRAHEAGLLPGDLVVSVDAVPVTELIDLAVLALPVSREMHDVGIWRRGRRQVALAARPATEPTVSAHGFVGSEEGLTVSSVIPGSLAARAGARPGDRLLAVNQRMPSSFDQVERTFRQAGGEPVHVVLERQGRMWGVLVGADD